MGISNITNDRELRPHRNILLDKGTSGVKTATLSGMSNVDALDERFNYMTSENPMSNVVGDNQYSNTIGTWIKSDTGKAAVDSLTQIYNATQGKTGSGGLGTGAGTPPPMPSAPPKKAETKILGMSPITFGLVAIVGIAVLSIVAIKVMKSKKATPAPAPMPTV